ncbi:MAG: DoxX family membrane protein [Ferruginibacter sp.]
MIKKASLYGMIILYLAAGVNHFVHPDFYIKIIPGYLPEPVLINIAAGIAELILGSLLIFKYTRKFAAFGIILMLVAFIPAHICMIQKSGCNTGKICWPLLIAWIRLIPFQFLLIWWAWINRK